MADKIWTFPASIRFSGQIFHVPGMAWDGGITAGGARSISPEPGGFSRLEIQNALAMSEWGNPLSSWLLSKTNGEIFKVKLCLTPQIATASLSGGKYVEATPAFTFASASLAGSSIVYVNFGASAGLLQPGHVIGHDIHCYFVDEIIYGGGGLAEIHVKPPLRKNIAIGNVVLFRPYFVGYIANGSELIAMYESNKVGNFEMPRIIFNEVIPNV